MLRAHSAQTSPAPAGLLQYVLRHMNVRFIGGSRQEFHTPYTLLPRTLAVYNFIHCLRGKLAWVVGGTEHLLQPGDLIVAPPSIEHSGRSTTDQMTLGSLHVMAELPGGIDVFELLQIPRVRHAPEGSALDVALRNAAEQYRRPEAEWRVSLPHWTALATQELLRHDAAHGQLSYPLKTSTGKGGGSDDVSHVLGILRDLDERLDQSVSLTELSRRSGFSAQHLNRIFRRTLGATPLQYLLQMKMERAASLLRDGNLTVKAVAAQLGYDDAYYFSRVFSQHFGMSPSDYRTASLNS